VNEVLYSLFHILNNLALAAMLLCAAGAASLALTGNGRLAGQMVGKLCLSGAVAQSCAALELVMHWYFGKWLLFDAVTTAMATWFYFINRRRFGSVYQQAEVE
jgi:hypothetical protein